MTTLTTNYQLITSKYIGTVSGSGVAAKDLYVRIYAKYTSQNIPNNQSTVLYKSTLYVTGSGTYFYTGSTTTKALNGSGATPISSNAEGNYYLGETTLCEISGVVSHSTSGTADVSMSASWSSSPWGISGTASGTASLPTIPRQATITSAPDFNDEQNPTITYINPAGNAATVSACISFDGSTDNISYREISQTGTSYTFNLTDAERNILRNSIPNNNSRTVRFYVRTIINGTSYWSSLTKTLTIVNGEPTFNNLGYYDSNSSITSVTGNNLMIVRNKSNLVVTYSEATAKKGASISRYSFTLNGVTKTSSAAGGSINFGTINSANDLILYANVVDSRGNISQTITKTIDCYDYYAPSFISFDAYRANNDGSVNLNGTRIKWDYNVKYAPVGGKNATTVKIYGIPTGSGSATSSGDSVNADDGNTYNIYAVVSDKFGGSAKSSIDVVYGPVRILNISPDGSNVSVGRILNGYDSDGVFDCRWKIKTGDPVNTLHGFSYRGSNLVNSIDNDTVANWNNQGNLATTFYTQAGQINEQPSQYGFLLNLTNGPGGQEAHQIWATQTSGSLLHRGGNYNGWSGSWREVLDSSNYTNYVVIPSDYIVEQGTSGNITYRKWNSGVSEAWYYEQLDSVPLTTLMTENVYSNTSYNSRGVTLPSGLFATGTIPIATANAYSNGYTCCQVASATPTQVIYRIWSPYSATITGCRISIQIVGRWK